MNKKAKEAQITPQIKIQLQMQSYLDRAIGYYIFARKAVKLGVFPVGGNLFHIAIEMMLHCGLSSIYSQEDLENKFRKHELYEMWIEFKKVFSNANLNKFDQFINHQKQWKDLRYPKNKTGSSIIFFSPKKPNKEIMKKNKEYNKSDIFIEINLEDMDEFMTSIIRVIGINPNHIKIHLQHNLEIMNYYLEDNIYPLFDSSKISTSTFLLR